MWALHRKRRVLNGLPKFSIVMPTFNQAMYIERSHYRINQAYPNLELIIDGGSSDETMGMDSEISRIYIPLCF